MPRRAKALVLDLLKGGGLIPVIRADSADIALFVADALVAGGIRTIEITMTVPDALSAIRSVRSRFGDDLLLGAGTVTDRAMAAGAYGCRTVRLGSISPGGAGERICRSGPERA